MRGHLGSPPLSPSPAPHTSPSPSVGRRLPHFLSCSFPLAVCVRAPSTPSSDLPTKASAPTPMVAASTCQLSPHLVWASLAGRPGGCWRGRVLWFLCPCPCRCRGPCASVCVCVCSLAACSTRSLTQQHCQLFPLNTTPPCPPPRHLGKQSHPLMRSHMLMSRDVSGIPSFLPPPPPPLRRFPLGAHTLRSLVKT